MYSLAPPDDSYLDMGISAIFYPLCIGLSDVYRFGFFMPEALMVLFTLSQDPACWWVVALMPSLMILFGLCRGDAMSKVGMKQVMKIYESYKT